MNKKRRDEIKNIIKNLEEWQSRLKNVLLEEEMAFDNMPEGLQGSERGMESEDAIDILNEVNDSLSEVIENLGGI